MPYNGARFYDDDALFAAYQQMRERPTNANITLERPIFRALTGSVHAVPDLVAQAAHYR